MFYYKNFKNLINIPIIYLIQTQFIMSKQIDFNPIKEDKTGVQAKRMIWSTKSLSMALTGIEQGRKLIANPFYENNTKLLKGDLVFHRTKEEISEWKKCKKDIVYFAEKYCKLMTPEGIKHVTLRDYQVDYLKHLEQNRLSIMLSARQAGKCVSFITKVMVKIDNNILDQLSDKMKMYIYRHYYNSLQDCYEMPLFELYNLFETSNIWKIKYMLYNSLYKLGKNGNRRIKTIIYNLLGALNEESDIKLVKSHLLEGIKIKSDEGWSPAAYIHNTKPFYIYDVLLDNGTILSCADEHILFLDGYKEVYVKDLNIGDPIMTEYGLVKVKSIKKTNTSINMCDITVLNKHESYYTNNILSHNTTTSALFMLHYICFNTDKNALVLGNKRKTAVEILDKAKKIFIELPFFLRPGIYKWNEAEIVLDNGCRLMAEATTINSGISFTFHCVLADEFAHIAPNILDKFYTNLFPTISAGRARFMITSTQNGYNLFYRLCMAAKAKENEYAFFEVTWDMIPEWNPEKRCWEKRDEEWRRIQVANYGSEEAFNSQFGTNFDISANTLISQKILDNRRQRLVEFVREELPGVPHDDLYLWKPGYNPIESLKNDYIIITADLAEGLARDYTVFMIHRMVPNKSLECVGMFRSNMLARNKCVESLLILICKYMNQNKTLLSHERNTYGDLFYRDILDYTEKHPIISTLFELTILVKYYTDNSNKNYKYGVKITSGNKTDHCLLYKESYETDKYINNSAQYMVELSNFSNDGTDHYKASFGNDDMVMAAIQTEFVKDTIQYRMMLNEFEYEQDNSSAEQETDATYEFWNNYQDYLNGIDINDSVRYRLK